MKAKRTCVVVADGRTALVFENEGPGQGLTPLRGGELHSDKRDGRGLFSDRGGRSFDSFGAGRHAMEPPTSAAEQVRAQFARAVVAWLDTTRTRRRRRPAGAGGAAQDAGRAARRAARAPDPQGGGRAG